MLALALLSVTLPACHHLPVAVSCPLPPSFPVELMQPAKNQFLVVPDSSKTLPKTPPQ
jgi:hypothetical protein